MIVVVVTAADTDRLAAILLPPTPRVVTIGETIFRFYTLPYDASMPDQEFRDLDNSAIIKTRAFKTIEDAEAWVRGSS